MALKKPMLVLKKIKCMDGDQSDEATSSRVELDVVGVIRHKILFKNRPKALISGMLFERFHFKLCLNISKCI